MTAATTLSLAPGQWRVGDLIGHRDGARTRRDAGRPALVRVTATTPTNQHRTRFRIDWTTDDGETGHFFIRNRTRELTTRPVR